MCPVVFVDPDTFLFERSSGRDNEVGTVTPGALLGGEDNPLAGFGDQVIPFSAGSFKSVTADEGDEGIDGSVGKSGFQLVGRGREQVTAENVLSPFSVRVLVRTDFESAWEVFFSAGSWKPAGDGAAAERVGDAANQMKFFAGHERVNKESGGRRTAEQLVESSTGSSGRNGLTVMLCALEAAIGIKVSPTVAAVIAHPPIVDVQILSGRQSFDEIIQRFNFHVAAPGAPSTDGRGFIHIPDAGFVFEVTGDQCSDGADVYGVACQRIVDGDSREDVDNGAVATFNNAQFTGATDLVTEPDTAGADDTAIAPNVDGRTELLGVANVFILNESTAIRAVLVGMVLEDALAGLVADGAVEGVVDQLELHDRIACIDCFFAIGLNLKSLGYALGTGDDGFR